LRSFLEEKLPEYMIPAVFMELEELPLTANGKIDRRALPAPTGQRMLPEQEFVAPRSGVEELLCSIWAEVLQVERVGIHDNFFDLGGDSILSIQVIARAREAGLLLTPKQLFQHQSIAALAALQEQSGAGSRVRPTAPPGPASGAVPLTPIQHAFFSRPVLTRQHWNQAVLLELEQELPPALLARLLEELLRRHDALRMRYSRQAEGSWQQVDGGAAAAVDPLPLLWVELGGVSEVQQPQVIERVVAQAQRSLDLERGPLLRAVLFARGGEQRPLLLVVIHHLAVDTYSWRILLEDLERGYEQLKAGAPSVRWGGQSSSYREWSEALTGYAQSAAVRGGYQYWAEVRGSRGGGRVPVEVGSRENRYEQRMRVRMQLAEEGWQALQEVCRVWRAQLREVLVAGLVRVLCRWLKAEAVVVELEGHGREELGQWLEVSRTVGWFTTRYPVVLRVGRDAAATLRAVKEQLRGVPQGGLGYGLLRYLSEEKELREGLGGAVAEVSFNYHGQLGERSGAGQAGVAGAGEAAVRLVKSVAEVKEGLRGGSEEREHVLEVLVVVRGGVLELEWSYSAAMHKKETIRRVAQEYLQELEQMMAAVRAEAVADALSPSDFPLASLSQEELDRALDELEFEGI
jgi:non-ribosomal peptide synthase protein (TIGR01720 family)